MHLRRLLVAVFAVAICLTLLPNSLRADAASDLENGRAALQAGELDKALPLLTSAAQDLPQSVEAQLALAECHLKLGQTDKALERYRKVLTLSPEHAAAKRIVDGLTGDGRNFAVRVDLAKTFMKVGGYKNAEPVLLRAFADAANDAERELARRLLVEVRLWAGNTAGALEEAVRLIKMDEHAHAGRVLAALAILATPDGDVAKVRLLLDEAKPAAEDAANEKADWRGWYNAAVFLLKLEEDRSASEVSANLTEQLAAIPTSPFRTAMIGRVLGKVLARAGELIGKGNIDAALAMIWPVISSGNVPAADAVGKPIEIKGGWLDRRAAAAPQWIQVAATLSAIGKAEFDRHGADANLLGFWLAAEVIRQAPDGGNRPDQLVQISAQLAGLSRQRSDRKPGLPLSQADILQLDILKHAQTLAIHDSERAAIVDHLLGQITRYQQAEDIETGLARVISIQEFKQLKPGERLRLIAPFDALPPGAAQQKLLNYLADRFAELGAKAFQEATATAAADANKEINRYDAAALNLYGQLAAVYPQIGTAVAAVDALIQRYAQAESWEAASDAATRFYAHLSGDAGRWAAIRLKLSQAQRAEDKAIAAQREIGKELSPLVKDALAEMLKIVQGNPSKANRRAGIQIAEPLVNRYVELERYDLAEAAISAVGDGQQAALGDWASWMRIGLLDRQAARALALATNQLDPRSQLALVEFHQKELEQIALFIAKYPQSEYLPHAVERAIQIAGTYQNHRSFAVAEKILTDFLKAHPKLQFAERIEFLIVQNTVAKATAAFADRKEKTKPPEKISDESAAAISALVEFLKKHPTGQFAAAAEQTLLNIAQTYGGVGAWPLAREVIERFAAAMPDFRSPAHLQLLRAATYLGELDRNYGIALLSPTPPTATRATMPAGDPVAMRGGGGAYSDRKSEAEVAANANVTALTSTPDGSGFGPNAPLGYGGANAIEDGMAKRSLSRPSASDLALAQVRTAQQHNLTTIAMLEHQDALRPAPQDGKEVALPSGAGPFRR